MMNSQNDKEQEENSHFHWEVSQIKTLPVTKQVADSCVLPILEVHSGVGRY